MFRRYCIGRYCMLVIIIFLLHTFCHPIKNMGTQRPKCFQIRQKCLRWFSLCFRSLFGYFGVARKTFYLFGCLRGTLVVTKVLGGFFVASESVSYPYGSGRKFEDMK